MRRQLNGSIRAEHEKCTMQMQMQQPLPIIKFIYLLSLHLQPAPSPQTDADTECRVQRAEGGATARDTGKANRNRGEIDHARLALPSPSELGQHQVGHNESNHKTNGQKKLHKS